ncbi:hypothetical protein [Conexibacter woesei]|uniref:hypothetical protein n=1 Tax=Conexibacter woesei TaxID=191495 RepID=UPI00041C9105|nr:hypothetical protein [Conexibacter woesei]
MSDDDDLPPLRTCPRCGREGRTRYERCPHCQASYFARSRAQQRRRIAVGAGVLAVVAAGLVVASVFAFSDRDSRERTENARSARVIRDLRAKMVREQAPHHDAAPQLRPPAGATAAQQLAARHRLLLAVDDRITADARARVKAGELDGPVLSTFCGPILKARDAVPDDRVLTKSIGRYDCVAIKDHVIGADNKKVAELGNPFVAALNFKTYTYTWCRNTPAQGEAGVALVFVRLDRACLAAHGRALGSGYAEAPGEQNLTESELAAQQVTTTTSAAKN